MTGLSHLQIETALKEIKDQYLEQDIVSAGEIADIRIEEGRVGVDLILGYPAAGYLPELERQIRERLESLPGVRSVELKTETRITPHTVQKNIKLLTGIKNIIAVASGKGGVGKSTIAVNLALALAVEGARVGILDADIYGPSQPRMLGVSGKPETKDGKMLEPLENYGIKVMSIGFLIDEETPMIWRGPMVTQALEQLLTQTRWGELDYLVVDLPPGTGDIQLTLAQKIPVSGAIIVTTPQDIALLDARKGLRMFEKVEVSVLGIVENMSIHICSNCGHEEHIFGTGGGQRMADDYHVPFLGALPLDLHIREQADSGKPTVAAEPESRVAQIYRNIARHMAARLATKARDYSSRFPDIVIQND